MVPVDQLGTYTACNQASISSVLVRQGFRHALRLTVQRQALPRRGVGCRRFVFNDALAHQKVEVAGGRRRPGCAALCARLPGLKKLHP